MWPLQNWWRQWRHLGLQRFVEMFNYRTRPSKLSTKSMTKYYQQTLSDLLTAEWRDKVGRVEICVACLRSGDDIRQQEIRLLHLADQFISFFWSLWRAELESWEIYSAQIRNKWNCRTSCKTSERRHFDSIGSVWACVAIFEKVHDLLADGQTHFMNVGSIHHMNGRTFLLEQKWNSIPYVQKSAPVWRKSLSWNIHGLRLERSEKLDWSSFDCGYGWSQNNASIRIFTYKGFNQKEVDILRRNWHNEFVFPCRDVRKLVKKDSRYPPLCYKAVGDFRQETQQTFSEEKEVRDPDLDVVEARQDSWSIMADCLYRNNVAPRTKLFVLKDDFSILSELYWCAETNKNKPWCTSRSDHRW